MRYVFEENGRSHEGEKMELTEQEKRLLSTICCEEGCYNAVARGYVCCLQCLHGTSERAPDEAVGLKKRIRREKHEAARKTAMDAKHQEWIDAGMP